MPLEVGWLPKTTHPCLVSNMQLSFDFHAWLGYEMISAETP
jgi:hypothetical protein